MSDFQVWVEAKLSWLWAALENQAEVIVGGLAVVIFSYYGRKLFYRLVSGDSSDEDAPADPAPPAEKDRPGP